jgi:hypothetical protein
MGHDIAKLEQRMMAVDQKVKRLENAIGAGHP